MTFFYLSILLVTVLSAYYYKKDLLSPVRLYICMYSFLLAVNSLKLSDFQTEWSPTTHLFFWGASGLFVAGCCIMLLVNRANNPLGPADFGFVKASLASDARRIDWKWFFLVWMFCSAVFLMGYAASFAISGVVPLLSKNADKARLAFFDANPFANIGIFFGPLSLILAVEFLFFAAPGSRRKWTVVAVSCAVLLLYSTIVTRIDLFRVILFGLVIYHYGKKRLSFAQFLYAVGFSVVFFLIFFFLRIKYDTLGVFANYTKLHIPKGMFWTANMYTYLVNNFWNLDFAFRKFVDGSFVYPRGYGFSLARPLLFLAHLEPAMLKTWGFDSIMNESIVKVKGFNTIAYVWHFYKDFGSFGVYFLPLFLGMLCTVFYVNTLYRPTLFRISLWCIFASFILLSFHGPLWELWFVYVNILFLAIAHKQIKLATG
ncbi:MAG TPA: O-antigen polymerase [Chitinivibrionales bacterium]|nr:O-antigen polymerase [Chitinivibrionales bacterium]